jgi:hypothetical protein
MTSCRLLSNVFLRTHVKMELRTTQPARGHLIFLLNRVSILRNMNLVLSEAVREPFFVFSVKKSAILVFPRFEKRRVIPEWSLVQFVHRFIGHLVFLSVIQAALYPCTQMERGNISSSTCHVKRDKNTRSV